MSRSPDHGPAPDDLSEREWVTLRDPDRRDLRYTFDVSFLLSRYRCIYGAGCPGIDPAGENPEVGCCLHGAYLNEDDDPAELQRVVEEELDPASMQHHARAVRIGAITADRDGEQRTRRVDGACIFLNRAGHPAGSGCALHLLAERRGEHHMTRKPQVCWQMPLHRRVDEITANDGGTVEIHTIAAFERGHWGTGGADFSWYCTESPEAFTGDRPLYRAMESELREMVGDAVYEALARHLDSRRRQRNVVPFLPVVG